MAFPTIATQADGAQVSNSTSWTLTYPSGIASGDLIIAIVGRDGTGTTWTWPGGFVAGATGHSESSAHAMGWAKKLADGTESGNFTLTTNSEQGIWQVLRITGWEGTLGTAWTGVNSGAVEATPNTGGSGTSNSIDPTSLNPTNWAVEDTLWIACASNDSTPTFTAKDANYTYVTNSPATSGGAGGASLAVAYRGNAVASEDPGAYTISSAEQWIGLIIAVRPAVVVERVPKFTSMPQLLAH